MNGATRDWLKRALAEEKRRANDAEYDLRAAENSVEYATKRLNEAMSNIEAIEADLIKN